MDADASPDDQEPSDSAVEGGRVVFDRLARRPGQTLALGVGVVLVLVYAVLLQQELLLVVWLLLVGFLVYLVWRFVRAHERIAGAAERLADDGD